MSREVTCIGKPLRIISVPPMSTRRWWPATSTRAEPACEQNREDMCFEHAKLLPRQLLWPLPNG
jgi:hypothetical protein